MKLDYELLFRLVFIALLGMMVGFTLGTIWQQEADRKKEPAVDQEQLIQLQNQVIIKLLNDDQKKAGVQDSAQNCP